MSKALFDTALSEAKAFYDALPALNEFAPWPTDISWAGLKPRNLPSTQVLRADPGEANEASQRFLNAVLALVPFIEWHHYYTEEQLGRDFLNRYCAFELVSSRRDCMPPRQLSEP